MRRLLIPAIILVVAVAIWLFQRQYEHKRISGTTIENFLNLDGTKINRMVFYLPSDTLRFTKEGPAWYLQSKPMPQLTDAMVINNVINAAVSITVGKVYSENPDQQSLFNVDSLGGIRAEFYDYDTLLSSVIIGKLTKDNAHTYIRKPGSDKVYASDRVLTYTFNRARDQWLDKTIFAINPDMVRSVELTYPGKAIKISLSDGGWYVAKKPYTDSIPADTTKITTYLNRLCFLRGGDFAGVADKGMINFEDPSLRIDILLSDSSQQMVEFAEVKDKESIRYYCRKPDRQDTLVVSMPIYNAMAEEFSDFLPD